MTYEHKLYTISGGASSQYGFDFNYIDESEVKVEVDGSEITAFNVNGNTINFEGHQVPAGTTLIVSRKTDLSQSKVKFAAGSAIRAGDLNTLTNQLLYSAQETEFKQLDITKAPGNVDEGTRSSIKASTNDADGLYDYIGKWMDQNGSFSYKLQVSQSAPEFRGDGSPLAQGDLWIDTGNGSLYYYWQTGTDPDTNTVINGWVETTLDPTTINHLATFAGVVGGDFQDCGAITDTTGSPGSAVNFATIADNITAINTVAGISADIDALVDSNGTALSDLQVVANDITTLADLGSVATPVTTTPGANYISEVGQNITDVQAVAGQTNNIASVVSNAADITTVAGSINALNRYADEYLIAAENTSNPPTPVPPTQGWSATSGDLWYNTTTTGLYYFTGSAWNATGGAQGPAGQGWTSGSYNATNGQVTFNSTFPALQFSTGDLRGTDGTDGTGWTGGSYDSQNGTVEFTSNDNLGFTTGDLRGAAGANGTLISYAGTAPGSPATNDFWIDSSTANNTLKQYNGTVWSDLFDIEGSDGTGFTGGTYTANTGVVEFTSNDGLGFSTGDLRGTDGTGFTGGTYTANTGIVEFTSNDGLGFSTGDLRGTDGADGTEIYYQTTTPTGGVDGDFWVDSNSTGKSIYRKAGGVWPQAPEFQMGMDLSPTQLSDVSAVANDLAQNNDLGSVTGTVTNTNTGGSLQTVASNLSDINAFNNRYQIAAAGPSTRSNSTALVEGDLYFDTTTDVLRAYDGSTWGNVTLTSAQLTDVSAVANDISSNNDLGQISNNVINTNTGGSLQTCATNIADINTVAGNTTNVNAVAGDIANVNTVATNATNVNTVAASIADVNSFANTYFIDADSSGAPQNISAGTITEGDLWFDTTNNILKVYDSASTSWVPATLSGSQLSDVAAVANDISQNNDLGSITVAASNTGTGGSLQTCAGAITNINNVGNNITAVANVSSNISDVNNFADIYQIASSAPSTRADGSALQAGDLYFNTSDNYLYYRTGSSAWDKLEDGAAGAAGADGNDGLSNLVADTTPQLGGDLDLNSNDITGTGDIDITGTIGVTSTDAGNSAHPIIDLYRNSASPAVSDNLGKIVFNGENDADEKVEYSYILSKILDESDGSEDGRMDFVVMGNGSASNRLILQGSGVTKFVNKDILLGQGINLLFEGASATANETTLTVVDPTQDNTITLPDATGTVLLNVVEDTTPQLGGDLDLNGNDITGIGNILTTGQITITSTSDTSILNPELKLFRSSASPADDDWLGRVGFWGKDSAANDVQYASIVAQTRDVTNTTGDGELWFTVRNDDVDQARLILHGGAASQFVEQNVHLFTNVDLSFEGSTSNGFETTLTVVDPTQDNTITFPDATGTVLLSSTGVDLTTAQTLENKTLDDYIETVNDGTSNAGQSIGLGGVTLTAASAHIHHIVINNTASMNITIDIDHGQSMLVRTEIPAAGSSISWIPAAGSLKWVTSNHSTAAAPTFSSSVSYFIEFWKMGTITFGALVGEFS